MADLTLYGQDHSPWVQAVLAGAFDKKLDHEWTTVPAFSYFLKNGVMMPAAKIGDEEWLKDSPKILEAMGYESVTAEEMRKVQVAWQGVLHRADRALVFLSAFSKASDQSPNGLKRSYRNLLRSFSSFYFFILIRFLAPSPKEPESYTDQFLYWVERLEQSGGPFVHGDSPNSLDFLLFGIVQCHCSVPVPATDVIHVDDKLETLRKWISAMQTRLSGYTHFYSTRYVAPTGETTPRYSSWDRLCFWIGLVSMFLLFPITVPLAIFYIRKARR